jgi:hypothetical protein
MSSSTPSSWLASLCLGSKKLSSSSGHPIRSHWTLDIEVDKDLLYLFHWGFHTFFEVVAEPEHSGFHSRLLDCLLFREVDFHTSLFENRVECPLGHSLSSCQLPRIQLFGRPTNSCLNGRSLGSPRLLLWRLSHNSHCVIHRHWFQSSSEGCGSGWCLLSRLKGMGISSSFPQLFEIRICRKSKAFKQHDVKMNIIIGHGIHHLT